MALEGYPSQAVRVNPYRIKGLPSLTSRVRPDASFPHRP
jgi:hypothetical protein